MPQGSKSPCMNELASGLLAIHLVTSQVMSLWPDSTVGIWNSPPYPVGVWIFGFSLWNSGSAKRLNGFPSTALSQPITLGGTDLPQPSFWKSYDWVSSLATSRGSSLSVDAG